MGTGVGEAALAAEAFGAAEAAGAVAGGAGIAEAGLLGGEFAGGLGLTGGIAEGLGSMAGLGGEYGGLSSLAPAFQTATAGTASVMPEVAAQTVQAANAGAVPPAGADFGWNPMHLATEGQGAGDIAAAQASSGFQNAGEFRDLTDLETADVTRHLDPRMVRSYAPDITPGKGLYDLGATDMSLGAAGEANAAAAATPSVTQAAGAAFDPSTMATINQGAGDLATKTSFGSLNPLTSVYNVWKDQDPLTKGVTGGIAALQAAKYLNKQPGVAAPAPYSGPLSKFSYNPNTYTPYTYKPYAAGGPVEEMSRENALGANTGYPQADIRQGAYATPWQTPVSRNVVTGPSDANVDQMTGEERMAGGGTVINPVYDPNYYSSPAELGSNAPPSVSTPGQGISSGLTGLGLGLMGISETAPPGIAAAVAGAIGNAIAANQADAMGDAQGALSAMSSVPGISTVSDANGNVTGISTAEGIAAADAAAGLSGEGSEGVGDSGGGDSGGGEAAGGLLRKRYADGGLAALSEYAQSLPAVLASRQNFADFLSQYQNLPTGGVTSAQAPTTYSGLYAGTARPGDTAPVSDSSSGSLDMGTPGGSTGAAAGGLMRYMAVGGMSNLGGYSDGGRLLKGPGDGMSDNIPANIGGRQPARLADGEFVVPADVVSGLGNGSTEAGAKQLYKMLDKVRAARTGTKKQGKQINPNKYLPA